MNFWLKSIAFIILSGLMGFGPSAFSEDDPVKKRKGIQLRFKEVAKVDADDKTIDFKTIMKGLEERAKTEKKSIAEILIGELKTAEEFDRKTHILSEILKARDVKELEPLRDALVDQVYATEDNKWVAFTPEVRYNAYACLMKVDAGVKKAYQVALKASATQATPMAVGEFLYGLQVLGDGERYVEAFPIMKKLLYTQMASIDARYVKVYKKSPIVSIGELEVYSQGRNVAPDGKPSQSSTNLPASTWPKYAIDGDPDFYSETDAEAEADQNSRHAHWFKLDLGNIYSIDGVRFSNLNNPSWEVMKDFTVDLLDDEHHSVWKVHRAEPVKTEVSWPTDKEDPEVRIIAMHTALLIPGKEKEVESLLKKIALNDVNEGISFAAMRAVNKMKPEGAGSLAMSLVNLNAVPDKHFAPSSFKVQSGKPVELTLSNQDKDEHNLIVVEKDRLKDLIKSVNAMREGGEARSKINHIPSSPWVFSFVKVLQPNESYIHNFIAPSTKGNYHVICSCPGHIADSTNVMMVVE